MRLSLSVRTWTCAGAAALVLTAGVMARRTSRPAAPPEELRDAVASPILPGGARPMPRAGAFAAPPNPRPVLAQRLSRLADALDAKAASLRSSARASSR